MVLMFILNMRGDSWEVARGHWYLGDTHLCEDVIVPLIKKKRQTGSFSLKHEAPSLQSMVFLLEASMWLIEVELFCIYLYTLYIYLYIVYICIYS